MTGIIVDRVSAGHASTPVLVDAEAVFPRGACAAVTGPSGAGKTTLLRLLNRLADPTGGRILLDGTPITRLDVLELRRRVGLVPQHPTLLTDTVADEIRLARPGLPAPRVEELLTRVGLPPEFVAHRCAHLSGGQAQRVCLARALAVEPDVLLLDEPTSALDTAAAAAVTALIGEHTRGGGAVVLVSHDTDFLAGVADTIWMLHRGQLTRSPRPLDHTTSQ
ncbi:ABC transporter ATP-binding protein [Nocardia gamkensis]|uniref:ABC transporter ATP-binding protein n=1 Tax=Nocardia gamkensis TaxID=352869 RepID=A0A7X6R222_9NOCA|nr:ABC transporter ATP-binding protein [Nocardia gamkensis]NKY25900.1 ABC transporter ATP-binding protein [Nocardia gamkensis]NQE68903.1 Sulfate/thiosulfate import ATP-binding protein CysA [Nocardia gamkensis]